MGESILTCAGVQIHSWGKLYDDESPNLEFVQPVTVYTVVNGEKTALDVSKIPSLTPRQIKELAAAQEKVNPTPPLSPYIYFPLLTSFPCFNSSYPWPKPPALPIGTL